MQGETQADNIIINHKVKVNFFLNYFRSIKNVTWVLHVDDSDESRYDMIIVRNIIITLG